MKNLEKINVSRKTGTEPLTAAGRPVGPTLADYWAWSRSDLLDNLERGVLAEFIVGTALGLSADGVRVGWATWDLTTPEGVRVEVKSAAYLQSWAQKQLSRISFATPETLAWNEETGEFADIAQRHAHVYVFALLAHTGKATVNPLDLDQWKFYVLPTTELNGRAPSQRSITLKALELLTKPVRFDELREAVSQASRTTA